MGSQGAPNPSQQQPAAALLQTLRGMLTAARRPSSGQTDAGVNGFAPPPGPPATFAPTPNGHQLQQPPAVGAGNRPRAYSQPLQLSTDPLALGGLGQAGAPQGPPYAQSPSSHQPRSASLASDSARARIQLPFPIPPSPSLAASTSTTPSTHHSLAGGPGTSTSFSLPPSVAIATGSVFSPPGTIVSRYLPTQTMLGHGAWGSVRLVLRTSDHAPFALKEFKRKPGDDEVAGRYERRCAHEHHVLALLRHPNIAASFEFEYDPGTRASAMVLELIPGGDLYTAISSNTLTNQREIDCLFVQIVRAVAYMHSRGVAHRDLKPENLLWDPTAGSLKIIDFGSAEVFAPPLPNTGPADPADLSALLDNVPEADKVNVNGRVIKVSRNVCGSAPYIAPEEFLGEGYDSRATDVWACAIIYVAMCTRKFPWQCAMKSDARYLRYLTLSYLPVLGRLPQASRKIISRMLQPDPTKRATVDEILGDFWFKHVDACQPASNPNGGVRSRKHEHPSFAQALEIKRAAAASSTEPQLGFQPLTLPPVLLSPNNAGSNHKEQNHSDDEATLNQLGLPPPERVSEHESGETTSHGVEDGMES